MNLASLSTAEPFVTKDGSTIRELHHTEHQSLAEAAVDAGRSTARHRHVRTEEIYLIVEGSGELELDGERRRVQAGDAVLIPPGALHEIRAETPLRFLCCCSPPYADDDTVLG